VLKTGTRIALLLVTSFGCGMGLCQVKPEEVTFDSGKLQLHGFLWKPSGDGPFPGILWNHGSEKFPGSQPSLATFYTSHSYVFFIPHRRGQGRSPGTYIQNLVDQAPSSVRGRRLIELLDEQVTDVAAALTFLRSKTFVDSSRIALSGCSYGGIETLLAGEHDLGVKALIPFAPGAMSWERNPELSIRLSRAIELATAPVFLLQAENDYSLGPSYKDFRSKIYSAFGNSPQDGHWGFCSSATDLWGSDVLAFLDEVMKVRQ